MRKLSLILILLLIVSCSSVLLSAEAQTFSYTANGPYYDDGSEAALEIGVAFVFTDGWIERFNINGTLGYDSHSETYSSPLKEIVWSKTSEPYDTRYIEVDPASEQTTYDLYTPSSSMAVATYAVQVSDFYGVTNAYLYTKVLNGGSLEIVEGRSLNFTGDQYFTLSQWGSYTFSVVCDQGTYSESFVAGDNTVSYKLVLTSGAFYEEGSVEAETITAYRVNETLIAYSATSNITYGAVSFSIYHLDPYSTDREQVTDYAEVWIGDGSGSWICVEGLDYYAKFSIAKNDGLVYEYIIPIPASGVEDFSDLESAFNSFGSLGVPALQILAFIVCIVVASIFSYANFELGAGAVVLCAVILGYLGFYVPAAGNIILGGFIVFLAYAHKAKMTERDI